MFEISAKKGLCDVNWGSEVKTSDFAAHFSRNSGAANAILFTVSEIYQLVLTLKMCHQYAQCARTLPSIGLTLGHAGNFVPLWKIVIENYFKFERDECSFLALMD